TGDLHGSCSGRIRRSGAYSFVRVGIATQATRRALVRTPVTVSGPRAKEAGMFRRRRGEHAVREESRAGVGSALGRAPALVLGVLAVALGLYALIRSGLDTQDLSHPHQRTFGVEHTPLLALCAFGFGVLLVLAAMGRRVGRVILGLSCAVL